MAKKFGKKEAIAYFQTFPDITKREAKLFVKGVGALFGIKNTAPDELDKDIAALEAASKKAAATTVAAETSLVVIQVSRDRAAEETLDLCRIQTEAIRADVTKKAGRVESKTARKINKLEQKIAKTKKQSQDKIFKVETRALATMQTIGDNAEREIDKISENVHSQIAAVKKMVIDLQKQIKGQDEKIAFLKKVKDIFTI